MYKHLLGKRKAVNFYAQWVTGGKVVSKKCETIRDAFYLTDNKGVAWVKMETIYEYGTNIVEVTNE